MGSLATCSKGAKSLHPPSHPTSPPPPPPNYYPGPESRTLLDTRSREKLPSQRLVVPRTRRPDQIQPFLGSLLEYSVCWVEKMLGCPFFERRPCGGVPQLFETHKETGREAEPSWEGIEPQAAMCKNSLGHIKSKEWLMNGLKGRGHQKIPLEVAQPACLPCHLGTWHMFIGCFGWCTSNRPLTPCLPTRLLQIWTD